MKVVLAKKAGACYGVQRALDMAEEAVSTHASVRSLGPLIHNPRVVETLEAKGLSVVNDLEGVETEAVLIRSHGVVPAVKRDVLSRGFELIDATCPHVARAQKAAAELASDGRYVIVVGEAGHPEVEGLVAYATEAGGKVAVVSSASDIPADVCEPVGIVVQTTQKIELVSEVVDALKSMGFDPLVKKTICSATTQRQTAAAEVAGQCDAMVVIGGRNSANTTHLANICESYCRKTYHIETPEELQRDWFEGCETVGVTAGASTPEAHIHEVIQKLESF